MKALTLTQPWATLVAIGAKRIETRSWPTKYRGKLAIHSSSRWTKAERMLVYEYPFDEVLIEHFAHKDPGFWDVLTLQYLPLGSILATANLVDCIPTDQVPDILLHPLISDPTAHEEEFGDYESGRYAWILDDVRVLKDPIPCKGSLGLWEVPSAIAGKITGEAIG